MAQRPGAAKQDYWLELIRRWQWSLTTVREFCQRHQVSEASFYSWRRVLHERGLLDEPMSSKTSADASAFVKLTTLDAEPTDRSIELVLNQRRLLRVRPGFAAAMPPELVRPVYVPRLLVS